MYPLNSKRTKDYLGGLLVASVGAAAVIRGTEYSVGTLTRMGPGFFPVALGAILVVIGLIIIAQACFSAMPEGLHKALPPEWRGWLCIGTAIIAFVVVGSFFGLLPATFSLVFVSALGDRKNTLKSAATLAIAVMVVCVVVFWWALRMPFPLFSWG